MGFITTFRPSEQKKAVFFQSLITMKVLVATEKPFAKAAVDGIREIVQGAGYQMALLEKYTDTNQLRAGAGYDNVDLGACTSRGIVVMNTPGQNSNAVAELAIGMMIFMARNQFTPGTGTEIRGKRLGIQAYGHVGRLVGRYGKAMGMEVSAYDPYADPSVFEEDGVRVMDTVEALYEQSDYLSLHIPATEQTKASIGYSLLTRMPQGATLVNTARKEVIDEAGLVKALEERTDLKYITDIAAGNQTALTEKFGKRVFATSKKMGAETAEAKINAGLAAARQVVGYLKDGDTKFQVNK